MIENTIVINQSKYGHSAEYANYLASILDVKIGKFKTNIDNYENIIFVCPIYGGNLYLLKKVVPILEKAKDKKVFMITVGMSNVDNPQIIIQRNEILAHNIPEDLLNNITSFHLSSGIKFSKLQFKDKLILSVIYKNSKKKDPETISAEAKKFIDNYNVNYTIDNEEKIDDIAEIIKSEIK
ncbi:flavodoxin domain-containing protein [Mycoplasma sp. P36-A1]|uniref:flavodoxin domain-containing protein n=1 Tax=Mycoplasma sp. P36-A1 TaxID=3252900 RepID=UPI003C2FFFE2